MGKIKDKGSKADSLNNAVHLDFFGCIIVRHININGVLSGWGGSQIAGDRNAITPITLDFFLILVGFLFVYRGDRLAQQVQRFPGR
jgi:hypothetical protein